MSAHPLNLPEDLPDAPELYRRIYQAIYKPLSRYHRLTVTGQENLPTEGEGGVIICPLHNGMLDASFVTLAAAARGRTVRWVGDDEIINNPVFGPLLEKIGVIPIAVHMGVSKDREQVKQVLTATADLLREGATVGVFPEGVIHPIFEKKGTYPFKTGIIRLAINSGAPIVPVWADGAQNIFPWLHSFSVNQVEYFLTLPLWPPARVTVRIGPPFHVSKKLGKNPTREQLTDEAQRLREAMEHLMGLR